MFCCFNQLHLLPYRERSKCSTVYSASARTSPRRVGVSHIRVMIHSHLGYYIGVLHIYIYIYIYRERERERERERGVHYRPLNHFSIIEQNILNVLQFHVDTVRPEINTPTQPVPAPQCCAPRGDIPVQSNRVRTRSNFENPWAVCLPRHTLHC